MQRERRRVWRKERWKSVQAFQGICQRVDDPTISLPCTKKQENTDVREKGCETEVKTLPERERKIMEESLSS